jgi:hypothetical protein
MMTTFQAGTQQDTTRRSPSLLEQPCRLMAALATGGASEVVFRALNIPPEQQSRIIAAVVTGGGSEVLRGVCNLWGDRGRG